MLCGRIRLRAEGGHFVEVLPKRAASLSATTRAYALETRKAVEEGQMYSGFAWCKVDC